MEETQSDAASCTASQSAFITETQPVELTGLALHLSNWANESFTNAGGAAQYLVARYPTNTEQKQFGDALMTHFPPRENIIYQEKGPIPTSEKTVGGKNGTLLLASGVVRLGGRSISEKSPRNLHLASLAARIFNGWVLDEHRALAHH